MKYANRPILLALALSALGGLPMSAALAAAGAKEAAPNAQAGVHTSDDATPIDESRPVAADALIDISNVRGAVTVTAGERAEVKVTGSLGRDSKLAITGDAKHLVLRVELANGTDGSSWWHGHSGSPRFDTALNLSVPRGAALKLDVVSASAQVSGIAGKSLDVEGVSGNLHLETSAPDISINCVSGDVVLHASAQGASTRAHIETVSGDVEATGLAGRIKLETVSGRIGLAAQTVEELDLGTVSGAVVIHAAPVSAARLNLESMSGNLALHVPATLSAHIEAETFSGRIRSDFGEVQRPQYGPGSSLDVRLGNGDAHIRAQSFSGNVDLHKEGG